jgi:hypothetical protein
VLVFMAENYVLVGCRPGTGNAKAMTVAVIMFRLIFSTLFLNPLGLHFVALDVKPRGW